MDGVGPMNEPASEMKPPKTLWGHVRTAWRNRNRGRSVSLGLLVATIVVLLLGTQMFDVLDDPYGFAFILTLLFVFFFLAFYLALVECLAVLRRHVKERGRVYRETIGEEAFVSKLRERVKRERDQ